MKSYITQTICVVLLAAGLAAGQCVSPGTETFDSGTPETPGFISCTNAVTSVLPAGWTTTPGGGTSWRVRNDATPSGSTGPAGSCPCPGGNYVTIETSGSCVTDEFLTAPPFDASGLANPTVSFCYHMWGADQGTLSLETFDGVAWTQVWSMTGDQGNQWLTASVAVAPFAGTNCATEVQFRFRYQYGGTGFTADVAVDEVAFADGPVNPTGLPKEWEDNQPTWSVDVNGVSVDPFCSTTPAQVNEDILNCPSQGGASSVDLNIDSTLSPGFYDLAFNGQPAISTSGGAINTAGGQVINLDVVAEFPTFLSTGTQIPGAPLQLPTFPGASSTSVTVGFTPVGGTTSIQGYQLNPAASDGFELSQVNELNINLVNTLAVTADDTNLNVDLTSCPIDCAGGFTFFGTNYTEVWVSPNGRIMFGGSDTDFTATVSEGQSDNPHAAGFWTDLSPNAGGTCTVGSPNANTVLVQWTNVPYFATAGSANTLSIELDCTTGAVTYSYDDGSGNVGVVPNTVGTGGGDAQLIGVSPGNTATGGVANAIASDFSSGMAGSAFTADDMLYDFNDALTNGLSPIFTGAVPTLGLIFSPNAMGGYDYLAF